MSPRGTSETSPCSSTTVAPWASSHASTPTRTASSHDPVTRGAASQTSRHGTAAANSPATTARTPASRPSTTGGRCAAAASPSVGSERDGRVSRLIGPIVAQRVGEVRHGAPTPPPSTADQARCCISPRMIEAVSDGVLPTRTPAASRASFFACAVPDEPETIAPAWPMVLPSGAVNPAT